MLFIRKLIWSSRGPYPVGSIMLIVQMTTLSDKLVKDLPKVIQAGRMELGWNLNKCRFDHYTTQHCKGKGGVSLKLRQWGQAKFLGHSSAACLLGQPGSNTQVGEQSITWSSLCPFRMPSSEAAVTQHLPNSNSCSGLLLSCSMLE